MKIQVIYWSGTGNTEAMAEAVVTGINNAGAEAELLMVSDADIDEAIAADYLALGCPAMGDEVLEEGEFEPFFADLEPHLAGKKLLIFGSYEWNEGQWMIDWAARCDEAGAILVEPKGLSAYDAPDDEALEKCVAAGEKLAKA